MSQSIAADNIQECLQVFTQYIVEEEQVLIHHTPEVVTFTRYDAPQQVTADTFHAKNIYEFLLAFAILAESSQISFVVFYEGSTIYVNEFK